MFENLTGRFSDILNKLSSAKRVDETTIKETLRDVRRALLEADVNFKVTREFCSRIEKRALGVDVMESLSPGQMVIKIVHDELVNLLGGEVSPFKIPEGMEAKIMLVGLQGSGKTTSAGKLAKRLTAEGRKPLLAAADIYRPAAIQQLRVVAERVDVPFFEMGTDHSPLEIARAASKKAKELGLDTVILDTAGRLHVDVEMMDEVRQVKKGWLPSATFLVVDSMVGQDAINQAEQFHGALDIDGTILTKLDGDTRGGAAISIRHVTGKPIVFAGMGERLEDLEPFRPDRMAQRILGMGDIMTLIEKAQSVIQEKDALELQRKMRENAFTLTDFLDQIRRVDQMGGVSQMMQLLPGMGGNMAGMMDMEGDEMKHTEAIILSMTKQERDTPSLISGNRRRRIAKGSGTTVNDVTRLLKQFRDIQQMMRTVTGGAGAKMTRKLMRKMAGVPGLGSLMGGGVPGMPGMPMPGGGGGGAGSTRKSGSKRQKAKKAKRKRR